MPEFLHLSTVGATTHQEVDAMLPALDVRDADAAAQVMVHVESHEMVDAEQFDRDAKWGSESHASQRSTAGYKVQEIV